MNPETLRTLVSGAIWRAEQLDDLDREAAASAWREVSTLEEEMARSFSAEDTEGRFARRGAVRAALKCEDFARADALVEAYSADAAADSELIDGLREMLRDAASCFSKQFPFATKRYTVSDIQSLARQLREIGPFWLVA